MYISAPSGQRNGIIRTPSAFNDFVVSPGTKKVKCQSRICSIFFTVHTKIEFICINEENNNGFDFTITFDLSKKEKPLVDFLIKLCDEIAGKF